MSLSTPRIRSSQSGNLRERCLVWAWDIFLNFDRAKRDLLCALKKYQFNNHR